MGTRKINRWESSLHKELEELRWVMESMFGDTRCQNFRTDCKDLITMIKEPHTCPYFLTEQEGIKTVQQKLQPFKISYVSRAQNGFLDFLDINGFPDFLYRTTRYFYRNLCFCYCSNPIYLPRLPQS